MDCYTNSVNHAVTIVGFGTDVKFDRQYFIIKNSFGEDWGENGYARISAHNTVDKPAGTCGILTRVYGAVFSK